ncbi:MAG: hypothetical protein RIN56_15670 [Sporomusaceae bacterium]|nr:hypothetical protein [Sporomusaceae bacterium]
MNSIYWAVAFVIVLIALYYIGKRKQMQTKCVDDKVLTEVNNAKVIGRIIYHGGMPQMPKPSSLAAGVLPDSLLLWNHRGEKAIINFARWIQCEKLTMELRPNTRGLLITLLGPLVFLFTKHKIRHFIVIKYLDCNDEENNILFECNGETNQQHVYDILHNSWQGVKKQRLFKRNACKALSESC